jgi:hypothetical protein
MIISTMDDLPGHSTDEVLSEPMNAAAHVQESLL